MIEHLECKAGAAGSTVAAEDDVKGGEVGFQARLQRGVVEGEGGFEPAGFREGGEDGVEGSDGGGRSGVWISGDGGGVGEEVEGESSKARRRD